jgi:hypothetical protein
LKIKLKGRNFDTIKVIKAELQAVLNTSQNITSRTNLKKLQNQYELSIHVEGDYFKGDGGQ